jgi:hypothetical protein
MREGEEDGAGSDSEEGRGGERRGDERGESQREGGRG